MFPEFRDLITQLKTTDQHFLHLFDKHNELDQQIKNMESHIVHGGRLRKRGDALANPHKRRIGGKAGLAKGAARETGQQAEQKRAEKKRCLSSSRRKPGPSDFVI